MNLIGEPKSRLTGMEQLPAGTGRLVFTIPAVMNTAPDGTSYPGPGAIPSIDGYAMVSARGKEDRGGTWSWEITMEGAGPLGTTAEQAVYSFEPADRDVPITSNPNWPWIQANFGAFLRDGVWTFPQDIPGDRSGTSNPFQGVESYLSFGATWSKTYTTDGMLPASAFEGVETIVESVPTPSWMSLPQLGMGRNWLKRMPSIRARGRSCEVTERYLLSGRGGHNPWLYRNTGGG